MRRTAQEPTAVRRPTRLDQVWFQHHSPELVNPISPVSYDRLLLDRERTMERSAALQYVADRRRVEDAYRLALGCINDAASFVYATIVGCNSMASAGAYPGYTYYFHMSHLQVAGCLFGTVTGDPQLDMPMETGKRALERCMSQWSRLGAGFLAYEDPLVGLIEPRVEVVIPFAVRPELFVPEIERRRAPTLGTAQTGASRLARPRGPGG